MFKRFKLTDALVEATNPAWPELNFLNCNGVQHINVSCTNITCNPGNALGEICTIFLRGHPNVYKQFKDLTFYELTPMSHNRLIFNWSNKVKMIFFNIIILSPYEKS